MGSGDTRFDDDAFGADGPASEPHSGETHSWGTWSGQALGDPEFGEEEFQLREEDAAILESVLDGTHDGSRRALKIEAFLSVLRPPSNLDADDLGRATYLRLKRRGPPATGLGEADAAAVDHWLQGTGHAEPERVAQLEALLAPVALELPDRAFADRVASRLISASGDGLFDTPRSLPFMRMADAIGVAAAAVVGVAIVLPTVSAARNEARKATCMGNLQATAMGFGMYADDHNNMLPANRGFSAGAVWSDVGGGADRSNAANLFQLVRRGYTALSDLACPGNEFAITAGLEPEATDWRSLEEVSYSYRLISTGGFEASLQGSADRPILADRSPILLAASQRRRVSPEANSPNHGGAGQHMLFGNGQVAWRRTPIVVGNDNAWLPRQVEEMVRRERGLSPVLVGNEAALADDVFLGP
ncbi:MAG: hypothetical protein AAGB51_04380 [Planctomycetota bacterium]